MSFDFNDRPSNRKLIRIFLFSFLFLHCSSSANPNFFEPTFFPNFALQLLFQENLPSSPSESWGRVSSSIAPGDYPLFLKSGTLDISFEVPVASQIRSNQFSFTGEAKNLIFLRDVIPLDQDTVRLFLSVDSSLPLPRNIDLQILDENGALSKRISNPTFRFVVPRSREAGVLSEPKSMMQTVSISSSSLLIVGGLTSAGATSSVVEVFDTESETTRILGNLPLGLVNHRISRLQDGRVLVTGGETVFPPTQTTHFSNRVFLINPSLGTITEQTPLAFARSRHTSTLLSNSRILVSGGLFQTGTSNAAARSDHELLDFSGNSPSYSILPVATASFRDPGGSLLPRFGHSSLWEPSTREVFFFSGRSRTEEALQAYLSDIQVLSIDSNVIRTLSISFSTGRQNFSLIQIQNREIYTFGGFGPNLLAILNIDSLNSAKDKLETKGFLQEGRSGGVSELSLSQNQVFSMGGMNLSNAKPSIEVFNLQTGNSFAIDNLLFPRRNHNSFVTSKGIFTLGDPEFAGAKVELYEF